MKTLEIRSTRVLGSDGRFSPAEISVRGAFIEHVRWLNDVDPAVDLPDLGTNAETANTESAVEMIDVGSLPITPAFVNGHTHIALGFLRGMDLSQASAGNLVEDFFFGIERKLSAEDVRAFARMGAYESLLHGVGLVWDHYYYADMIVEALLDVGLAGVVAPTLQDLSGPGVDQLEQQLEATERIAGDSALKEMGVFVALGAHATDTVSADLWRRIGSYAERLNIPVHSHAAQSAEECCRAFERHGVSPLRWLKELEVFDRSDQTLLVHCLLASDADLALLPQSRTTLGFCPYAQRVFGFPADPRRWSAAGVDWFVATDTSAGNDSMNLQKELRAVAELRTTPTTYSPEVQAALGSEEMKSEAAIAGLKRVLVARDSAFLDSAPLAEPRELLSRVWQIPGGLHSGVRAGAIEPGALANLLVWDTDHPAFWPAENDRAVLQALAMGDTTAAIHTALVAGQVVGRVGDFAGSVLRSEQYREARLEADARFTKLMAS